MTDEPIQNSNAKVNLAGKSRYPSYSTVVIGDNKPVVTAIDAGEATSIVFVICAAVVACVLIVSVATYEIAKLKNQTQQVEDRS